MNGLMDTVGVKLWMKVGGKFYSFILSSPFAGGKTDVLMIVSLT